MTGRPSSFTEEQAGWLCTEIASGRSLRSICEDESAPEQRTVFRWLAANESFRQQYARAREAQADAMLEDMLEIADDGRSDSYRDGDGNLRTDQDVIARSRLRVEARKWAMSKMAPKKYGDKLDIQHGGDADNPIRHRIELVDGQG